MKKTLVIFLAVLLVSVLSCTNPFLKKMLVEDDTVKPDLGSFEDAGDFVKIIPPANGIAGVEPDPATLPGNEAKWKGVFIAGRKVKLSPYKLGKTEVTYKLWKEVYDWATGKGYQFAHPGTKGSSGTGNDNL